MGKPKVEPLLKHVNRFAALADSDDDLPDDDLPDYAPLSPSFGSEVFTEKPCPSLNLEPVEKSKDLTEVSAFRQWKNDVTRFSSNTNIFSSPFSRKGKHKKEEDGWTSIESGVAETVTHEFPSMLGRGDVADALVWAEKVKTSLDKARHRKLSFFRRTVVLDEKF